MGATDDNLTPDYTVKRIRHGIKFTDRSSKQVALVTGSGIYTNTYDILDAEGKSAGLMRGVGGLQSPVMWTVNQGWTLKLYDSKNTDQNGAIELNIINLRNIELKLSEKGNLIAKLSSTAKISVLPHNPQNIGNFIMTDAKGQKIAEVNRVLSGNPIKKFIQFISNMGEYSIILADKRVKLLTIVKLVSGLIILVGK